MVYDRSETHGQLVRNYGSNAAQVCATDAWNGCKIMVSAEKTNGDNGSVSTTDAKAVKNDNSCHIYKLRDVVGGRK